MDYADEGSPFADWFETFTFRSEDRHEFTRRLHVLKANTQSADDAPDYYLKQEIARAAFGKGNPIKDWVGRIIGVTEEKGELVFWYLPDENPPPDEPEPATPPEPVPPSVTQPDDWPAWMDVEYEYDEEA
ncbi:hypothetical protein GGD65_005305 [Bradyrhizobium sp. CIR18]|uniref:hypothetical protein n=1 Tax=Bradyrhizobium sp. CIR18 TaxID=2663839 RepID=UPI00160692A9|nr:hypothetical protein [Bradyrhizobium sp. CIR18]MBB4364247.1 hypothetical protein [Bradyrhizobium sp. CIR18]